MDSNSNEKVFKNISILFENLLKHSERLNELAKDIDTAKENEQKIIDLGVWHIDNRNLAKKLANEIPNCKGNLMFSVLKNNLREQIVVMTNLATNYQEQIEKSIKENDEENLKEQIQQISSYYIETKKMKNMFLKMSKK